MRTDGAIARTTVHASYLELGESGYVAKQTAGNHWRMPLYSYVLLCHRAHDRDAHPAPYWRMTLFIQCCVDVISRYSTRYSSAHKVRLDGSTSEVGTTVLLNVICTNPVLEYKETTIDRDLHQSSSARMQYFKPSSEGSDVPRAPQQPRRVAQTLLWQRGERPCRAG